MTGWLSLLIGFVMSGALPLVAGADSQPAAASDKGMEGSWVGTLKVPGGMELTVVVNISRKPDGTLTGTLDSPDQGAKGIPITQVAFQDGSLRVEVQSIGGVYEGKLSEVGDELTGEWKQGGASFPLTMKRGQAPERRRPQEPQPPYPYREEEVVYQNEKAGIQLAGTLTLPPGAGPFPAVVLITGSGPEDRNETVFGHKPFLVLADYLTRQGIAVLRADDRGVGQSTGSLETATTFDFTEDALAGVAYLKTRPEINLQKIGLIGHSEGGIIAPIAAVKSPEVAFIVLMAGTGVNGEQVLYRQGALMARALGATEEKVAQQRTLQEQMFTAVKEETDNAAAEKKIREAMTAMIDRMSEEEKKAIGGEEAMELQIKEILTPWFRQFLTLDPAQFLKQVQCPVLAINGEKDLQVDPKQNLPEIEKALKEGGNRDYTVKELPGLNHLFQPCETGSLAEYTKIEETLSPAALKVIGDWILEHTRG